MMETVLVPDVLAWTDGERGDARVDGELEPWVLCQGRSDLIHWVVGQGRVNWE